MACENKLYRQGLHTRLRSSTPNHIGATSSKLLAQHRVDGPSTPHILGKRKRWKSIQAVASETAGTARKQCN